ncbi:MAG: bifunctional oligoribonuclease/PAP phosphatase NrnA [Spirochaetales bacterium]|nr:bifunctional oligoribonuclease/PAP phosphatase NrnA [Spirochaetales bacterium]
MKAVPQELRDLILNHDFFIIAGHKEPDGDCVGSCLALASYLERKGKKAVLLSAGPFKRVEIRQFETFFSGSIAGTSVPDTAVSLILDCSDLQRTGDAGIGLEAYPQAVIDHHATNGSSGPADFVDSSVPATTLLVLALIESCGDTPNLVEAEHLLFGMCTDTGFFRHLDASSAETFQAVSRLVSCGANPKKTFARMNGGKSFGSRILISRILSRMQRFYNGQLVISWENLEETEEFGMEGRDSDSLYQLIQSISGVEAIVIVRQETPTNCTVGFRSLDRIDVSIVASRFGGGGHRQASGLSIPGTIEELIPRFVEAFQDQFSGS